MLVHEPTRSLLIRSRNPQAIRNILPATKEINYEGHNLAVRHGLDEVRILRNLGIQAPPPILYYYPWPGKYHDRVLQHQRETASFLTLYPRCFCLDEPGTCKTVSSLWAADYLISIGQVRKVLIVAPLSTLDLVWADEIFGTLLHRTCAVLHGSAERRIKLFNTPFDFYIINHHGLGIINDYLKARNDIDLLILDESAEYRNSGTNMYEDLVNAIGRRRLWMLTGTPCPRAPTDAWAQARLVDKSKVPQYFSQWKRETMMQVSTYKWIPRADSYQMAFEVMQPAIRHAKKDCLDLPPVVYEKRQAELTPEQKKAYTTMRNQFIMLKDGTDITAVNAGDRLNKLRQILCGVIKVPNTTDKYVELDHSPRVDLLMEEIGRARAKVLVIVPYKGIVESLKRDVSELYSCEIINGDVSKARRDVIFTAFKNDTDPHVLLCHPEVMAHGLNLTEADTTIFYAPIYSNAEDQQVIERFNRPGQDLQMTVVLIGAHALEWEIYKSVAGEKAGQQSMLDLYRNEVLGA
jgi:SNF2 family DNA or RNA helicase